MRPVHIAWSESGSADGQQVTACSVAARSSWWLMIIDTHFPPCFSPCYREAGGNKEPKHVSSIRWKQCSSREQRITAGYSDGNQLIASWKKNTNEIYYYYPKQKETKILFKRSESSSCKTKTPFPRLVSCPLSNC